MQYFSCILIQLFLICWSGNRITVAADHITSCLYESNWFSCSERFKKSMLLTMIRMKRPLYLSIGKFSPLTLSTVMVVCRGSFSYFTMFKSIQ
ncbi:unnamed protein product [Psylliodes chrysocephalus]|uniref:Uncharacterized protein n=1 Tax=Psylliodes chrysocephalus TaxID=3402493 RepID=A0A9P0CMZ0_9CUCU|nr:unnamed protein product [Psylliodes chrysocephala]